MASVTLVLDLFSAFVWAARLPIPLTRVLIAIGDLSSHGSLRAVWPLEG